ncbi:MAG: hypothetical protein IPK69_05320 [Phycisphaerales bacterium]|nr:MAG: hypothetical protein IPK69_05320 [Phycisphaerales bacterium]
MARIVPTEIGSLLAFAQTHAEVFLARSAEIGLTPEQASLVANAYAAARAARDAQADLMYAYRAATQEFEQKKRELQAALGVTLRRIKVHAEATRDTSVYARAEIPAPATARTTVGAPAAAMSLTADLHAPTGALTIQWKSRQPRGVRNVTWTIERRLDAGHATSRRTAAIHASEWTTLGMTGDKSFTDTTLPAGTRAAHYRVTARSGGNTGPTSATLIVHLGSEAATHAGTPAVVHLPVVEAKSSMNARPATTAVAPTGAAAA